MTPCGYLPDGTPLYFKPARGSNKTSMFQLEMYRMLIEEEMGRLAEASIYSTSELRFFVAGTGLHDSMAIEYWKNTEIIVVTRNGEEWQRGKRIK